MSESRSQGPHLFDEAFYRAHYAEEFDEAVDPETHFVEQGAARGFMPNPHFDPVLYRLLRPEARAAPWATFRKRRDPALTLETLPIDWPDAPQRFYGKHAPAAGLAVTGRQALAMGEAGRLEHTDNGTCYRFRHPAAAEWLERIESNNPFASARIPHGLWDALCSVREVDAAIRRDPRFQFAGDEERWSLATRYSARKWPWVGAFSENFLREVLGSIARRAEAEDLRIGISFKGFPTPNGSIFPAEPPGEANLRRFATFTEFFSPDETLFDATLWKRWAICGALACLPDRLRPHPLLLIGPQRLGSLAERWRHERIRHIAIPDSHTHLQRHAILQRCREILNARSLHGPRPIVLTQCGGSLAFWFVTRLHREYPDVFLIDLGQSLDSWFFDVPATRSRRGSASTVTSWWPTATSTRSTPAARCHR